jgi:hypothetical protein
VDLSKNVPRERLFFKTKEEAEVFAQQKRVEYSNFGTSQQDMPDAAKAEAGRLWKQLKEIGCTLTEAVSFFLKHARPDGGEKLIKEVVDELSLTRQRNGRSKPYLPNQSSLLGRFSKVFGQEKIHNVMHLDIDTWLNSHSDWSPRSRRNYQRSLSTLWEFAIRKRYVSYNPVKSLDEPNVPPGILKVAEAEKLLRAASKGKNKPIFRCPAPHIHGP